MKEFKSMKLAPNYPRAKFRLIETGSIAAEMCAKLAHMHDYFVKVHKNCVKFKDKDAESICVFITMIEENFDEHLRRNKNN